MTKVILILHDLSVGSRRTNRDHVYNFSKYQKGNLYIFHCARAPITDELKQIDFDGVIIIIVFWEIGLVAITTSTRKVLLGYEI